MKSINLFTLSALSLALAACGGGDSTPPNQIGSVSVSGVAKEGETLTATVTDPDGFDAASVQYRWVVGGAQIEGATSSTYTLTANEAGEEVYVSVVYVDSLGYREAHTSAPSATVEGLPVNSEGAVVISGAPTQGQTLTAEVSDENGISGTVSYVWSADGNAIAGATSDSLELTADFIGQSIAVAVTYTDDQGFEESLTSGSTLPVQSNEINTEATLTLLSSQTLTAGNTVNADLLDPNGTSNAVFVWRADGEIIDGQQGASFTPDESYLGMTLSVSADYIDDDGYIESVSDTALGVVHSVIVNGLGDLADAAATLNTGAVVGLNSGDYDSSDVPANEVNIAADDAKLVMVHEAEVVLSGNLCLHISGNNVVVDGLQFAGINLLTDSECAGNGPSSVYLSGNNIQFINNTFDSAEASHGLSDYSWIGVKGLNNLVSRNSFTDSTGQKVVTKGGVISIYANDEPGEQESNTVSYNLFKDFGAGGEDSSRNSSAYMIQVGRSTGSDSRGDGLNTIEYNLFSNVNLDRRYMRVQSGRNTIRFNTFIDGSGMIAFEDGVENTATHNVFINTVGDNPDDGGISYAPYGHTITHNYIAGLRTTSGDRGGIYANSTTLDNSGNSGQTPSVVTVANNTILNSREAIEFASKDCQDSDNPVAFLVDFDDNLVANGETGNLTGNEANGQGREAIQDDCDIDTASDFDGNHIYSAVFTNSGGNFFDLFSGASNNVVGVEAGADIVADTNGLWQGQNADAGKGADTSALVLLSEADVGPGSGTE